MLVTNTRRTYAISVSWNGNVHRNRQFKWIRTKVMIDKDKLADSIVLIWREALRFNLQWDKFNCLPATHRWLIYRKIGRGFAFYTSFHCWRACMRISIHRISMYLKRSTFCAHSMKSMCNTEKYCLQSSITVPMTISMMFYGQSFFCTHVTVYHTFRFAYVQCVCVCTEILWH